VILKNSISALEQQKLHLWMDRHKNRERYPGNITGQQKTAKHPLIPLLILVAIQTGNCILFLWQRARPMIATTYLMFKLAHYVKDNPALFKDKCVVIVPLLNPMVSLANPHPHGSNDQRR